ncbi:peptidoglycan-binding protein [Pseudalkalibacillus caeni]|uniref:Peptidoglycan-binding protein n=1 Tax=Exobacillus caeni TaxID=2574798 RepID=A0A5R9F1Z8_9BACL|nr:peptidoglycan-binding protein [Pseudalkalibacillus caeni]TLS34933.1 hypothetical protein FCL54_23240 [Pseudalkalibacillus caeni]
MLTRKNFVRNLVTTTAVAGMMFASPVVSNAMGDENLSNGSKSADVVELQDVLTAKGYFDYHKSTGYFGSITTEAVKSFQKDHGLRVDGIVGPNTFDALEDVNNGQALQTMVEGDRGHQVVTLQEKLGNYYNFTVDGIFGPITAQAVKAFQQDNGLSVDGIAGQNTWAALNGKETKNVTVSAEPKAKTVSTTTNSTSTEKQTVSRSSAESGKEFNVEATAYTANCTGCSGITATGINLKSNPDAKVIAVDPDVIPLGSKVYVEGYGYAIAGDTGGAINGNRIDIFIPNKQDALDFGRRTVKVKVLN